MSHSKMSHAHLDTSFLPKLNSKRSTSLWPEKSRTWQHHRAMKLLLYAIGHEYAEDKAAASRDDAATCLTNLSQNGSKLYAGTDKQC